MTGGRGVIRSPIQHGCAASFDGFGVGNSCKQKGWIGEKCERECLFIWPKLAGPALSLETIAKVAYSERICFFSALKRPNKILTFS